jgi:hypothetical protein
MSINHNILWFALTWPAESAIFLSDAREADPRRLVPGSSSVLWTEGERGPEQRDHTENLLAGLCAEPISALNNERGEAP